MEGYLQKRIRLVQVPEEDIEEAYDRSKDQFTGLLAHEAKYRIRRRMEEKLYADSMRRLLDELRRNARVRSLLAEEAAAKLDLRPHVGPARRRPHARITVIAFNDFECPYCRRDQPLLNPILEEWPGEVRLVFKHFPLAFHRNAFSVAVAPVCAEQQERFWDFREMAFEVDQDLSPQGLNAITSSLGLDMEEFRRCMASPEAAEKVRGDLSTGQRAGVDGTPTYFVNKQHVRGTAELEGMIAEILSREP